MPLAMMDRTRPLACAARRTPFMNLRSVPWGLVVEFLLEVPTELDETTSTGMEGLGRLGSCSWVLRSCLFDRLVASRGSMLQMTHSFIWNRVASLEAHPNIILRGRLWHAYEQAQDDPESMHVRLAEML
ncbi:FCPE [Symbiodinium sp. CCMP2456]|nr:FCPE [Symbiodinium sp. CCMP2456]